MRRTLVVAPVSATTSLFAACVIASALGAQGSVGHISDIKQLDKLDRCPCDGVQTRAAETAWIWRRGTPTRADRDEAVHVEDSLEVVRRTDVRVQVSSAYGTGAFYLTPDLLRCTQAHFERVVHGVQDSARAHYAIKITQKDGELPANALHLIIARGAAFVQWTRAPGQPPLVIHAGGEDFLVPGTEVAIIVNEAGTAARVFVRSGVVAVRGPPEV